MVNVAMPGCNRDNYRRRIHTPMTVSATLNTYHAIHRLRLLSRYLSGSSVCPGLPPTVVIANTHACNHFCRMCIRDAIKFDGLNIEVRLLGGLFDEATGNFRSLS